MKYPVSVWMGYYPEYTAVQTIDALADAGFTHSEWSVNCTEKLFSENPGTPEQLGSMIAAHAKSRDFTICQGHLSFKQGLCDEAAVEKLKKELDFMLAVGIKAAVVHCNGGNDLTPEMRLERRVHCLSQLADHLKGTDLVLCLENLGSVPETHTVERLKQFIEAAGAGDNLGICLDMGHLHLTNGRGQANQSQREFILGAGDLLKALHVTNNSGQGDDHLMPYSSRLGIDYREVIRALDEIGYKGLFNLEILGENRAPMAIRRAKLDFIRTMCSYMLSDEFLTLDETYPLL